MLKMTMFVCLALAAVPLWAARPLELPDYYRVESAATPAISPDGRWVAFVRNSIVEADNTRHSEIWLAPADGSAPAARLTNAAFSASAPRWTPDGKLLSFRSVRKAPGSEGDVWFLRMDRPGGEAFQIPGVGGAPIFSPDNQWIAFTQKAPSAAAKPREAATPIEKQLEQRFKGRMYDWMNLRFDGRGYLPDPRDPAVTPPLEVWVVAREGGTPRQVTHLGVDVTAAVWRPDSAALAIEADSHQRDEYSYERSDLWVVTLDGQARRLTDDGYEHRVPAWSPDGKWLVFGRSQGLNQVIQSKQNHGAKTDLYRMAAEGGAMTKLTGGFDLSPNAPAWHGDSIYFTAATGGDTQLFRMAAGGGKPEQLTRGERAFAGFSFSQAYDRIAYTAADATHPAEAFAARTDGTGETRLSSFNEKWLGDVELSAANRIRYKSKDGTEIEGWVMLPRRGSQPYPMVLSIHGGPHGAYGSNFDYEFQWLAANGYAVLYTNPRGSTGYGDKFEWATWGGWGKLDTEDVMAGVDYALGHYPIDPKRLGVTGYSYGGFLTNWIITQTPRFSAAVTGAGVSNWLSDYGTADIPRTKESEFYGAPWEPAAAERMRGLSPITYAANVKTPTLFLHGESDMRVPIEEAEQMYTALKKQRVPAKFIRYPGNYHGGWPPWDTVHRYYYELQWWKEYLK